MIFDAKEWVEYKFETRKAGTNEYAICCPMCNDRRYRLYICVDPKKKTKSGNLFPCWCHNEQQTYSLAEIYSAIENVHLQEAIGIMEGDGEAPYSELDSAMELFLEDNKKQNKVSEAEVKKIEFPRNYFGLFNLSLEEWEYKTPAYMKHREITQEMCDKYNLGFTSEGPGVWDNRLIIPIYMDGKLITYQGRAMYETNVKKYYFKKIENEDIKVGDCLFGIDDVNCNLDYCILVEGAFDAWAIRRAGYNNCIASFGKHLTESAMNKILSKFKKIYICWDLDAKEEIVELIERLFGYIEIYVVNLNGKDPDQSTTEQIVEAINGTKKYTSGDKLALMLESIQYEYN